MSRYHPGGITRFFFAFVLGYKFCGMETGWLCDPMT